MAKRKNYPGCIRKRKQSYEVILQVAGQRHGFTVKGTKPDAERFARAKYDELQRLNAR